MQPTGSASTASQLYAPYGSVRYSNGTMPTDYGFTSLDYLLSMSFIISRLKAARSMGQRDVTRLPSTTTS